jgi:hypothetical protein
LQAISDIFNQSHYPLESKMFLQADLLNVRDEEHPIRDSSDSI